MSEHALHVYSGDSGLATTVAAFLSPAFAEESAILSIGTRAHVAAIEQRLRTDGYDVDGALRHGRYLSMDAERIIPSLLRDGLPTSQTFDDLVGSRLRHLTASHGNVRAFGEIVSLLWRDGKRAAALRLEDLWNESLGYHPLSLVCGYSERVVGRTPSERIVTAHTRLIDESGSSLSGRGDMAEAAS
jgi:hypothetical protein